jgi:tetratricopeptide (TPR) repeat protein
MFSTDQFRVFSGAPEDRLLSRPRRLLQEGRMAESESAYIAVLQTHPEIKQTWVEYFALLRHARRHADALALGKRAADQFGDDAMPAALRGAALVELGEFRDGLEALDHAARLNPNLGLVWHEAGYAAYRLGELSRALMALDRAFALEPHGGTLHLRGQVLRKAGRYLAAEVAFEGAAEAAEFQAQRDLAEREIAATRRYGIFPERRPDLLAASYRWFADTGAVPLTSDAIPPASDREILEVLVELCRDSNYQFTSVVALDEWDGWLELAAGLSLPLERELSDEKGTIPLVVARRSADLSDPEPLVTPALRSRGMSFVMEQGDGPPVADVFGYLASGRGAVNNLIAFEAAHHPHSRLQHRTLS